MASATPAPIAPPDSFHLSAAVGWLELGNPQEARAELARLSPAVRHHPDVLETHWSVHAATHDWESALPIAEKLVEVAPDRASGWLHLAYARRRVPHGGLSAAWDTLHPAFERFPKEAIIPFNLACYAAQLGRADEAWDWLHRAMEAAGDVAAIRKMALQDPDLEPLWERLRGMENQGEL